MKHFYLVFILITFICCSENETSNFKIPEIDTFRSTILEKDIDLIIYLPDDYSESKSYPTLYLLDGKYFLQSGFITNIASAIDKEIAERILPKVILVGIGNDQDRNIDYTFPQDEANPESSGGGVLFNSFIIQELIPYIELSYSTDSSTKVLMGHSLGGYFSLITLYLEEISPFTDIISSSPALSYAQGTIFNLEFATPRYDGSLYVTVGGEEANVVQLNNKMVEQLQLNQFTLRSEFYKQETHRSVAVPSFIDGLYYIFN